MVYSQIFKQQLPNNLFYNLLDNISVKQENRYVINKNSYKKGLINNSITEFLNICKSYYYDSKQKYLERKLTYNTFMTILRQICNTNKLIYTSQIKYCKSRYDIEYYIYDMVT